MLGHMMEEPNKKTLRNYVKLGEQMGLWSLVDQEVIDLRGNSKTQRLIISWENDD